MTPERFAIVYIDGSTHEGESREDWLGAPSSGVHSVLAWPGYEAPHLSPWARIWRCRVWTGLDEYDPFGWGSKRGALTTDDAYRRIWEGVVSGNG